MTNIPELSEVTRLVVIDHRSKSAEGIVFSTGVQPTMRVQYSMQDNGRTLKVFVSDRAVDGEGEGNATTDAQ